MRWLETDTPAQAPVKHRLAALIPAIERHPDDPALLAGRGLLLRRLQRYDEAASAFARAIELNPAEAVYRFELARCLRDADRPADALAACDGAAHLEHFRWHIERGRALLDLGRVGEGRAELTEALRLGDVRLAALRALLKSVAQSGDGPKLLETCDALDPRYRDTAGARGYRALALSMIGHEAEARDIVDLDRCVMRLRFQPPPEFSGIAAFNRALADQILADPPPADAAPGRAINYAPRTHGNAPLTALRRFIRNAIEDYVRRSDEFASPTALPLPPEQASIGCSTVVLKGTGTNGEHLHANGYLSTVYHVHMPEGATAQDDAGALVLGPCGQYSGGHQPCWGTRKIAAEPGWLTVFPSHVFHDVIPTHTSEPRLSIASDLKPLRPGSTFADLDIGEDD